MDRDIKDIFYALIIGMIILTGVLSITTQYHLRTLGMADKGYCERQVLGSSFVIWDKCSR